MKPDRKSKKNKEIQSIRENPVKKKLGSSRYEMIETWNNWKFPAGMRKSMEWKQLRIRKWQLRKSRAAVANFGMAAATWPHRKRERTKNRKKERKKKRNEKKRATPLEKWTTGGKKKKQIRWIGNERPCPATRPVDRRQRWTMNRYRRPHHSPPIKVIRNISFRVSSSFFFLVYRVSASFHRSWWFYSVFYRVDFSGIYLVLLDFIGLSGCFPLVTEFYWVFHDFAWFDRVLLGFT